MKSNFLTRVVLPVHDLLCALGELESAARGATLSSALRPIGGLAVAAVAFTVQLAIEVGQDPTQMRALERELIAKLTAETP